MPDAADPNPISERPASVMSVTYDATGRPILLRSVESSMSITYAWYDSDGRPVPPPTDDMDDPFIVGG